MSPIIKKIIRFLALSTAILITVICIFYSLYLAAGVVAIYCAIGVLVLMLLFYVGLYGW